MHRVRKAVAVAGLTAIASTLLVFLAVLPAHAAAGANVVWVNPPRDGTQPGGVVTYPPSSMVLSSHDGMMTELDVAANGGDDWYAATTAFFYIRNPAVLNANWILVGSDSTPSMPDAGAYGFFGLAPRPFSHGPVDNLKGFQLFLNTAALPGGITSSAQILVEICGQGTTSFDGLGGVGVLDAPDRNVSTPTAVVPPTTNCDNQGFTIGQDIVTVGIDNTRPVVNIAQFPDNGYNGDGIIVTGSQIIKFKTTPDTSAIITSACLGVDTDTVFSSGQASTFFGGGGCTGWNTIPAIGGPTDWTLSVGTGFLNNVIIPAVGPLNGPFGFGSPNVRLEAVATSASTGPTAANHYVKFAEPNAFANTVNVVTDYISAPGAQDCENAIHSATSRIAPWSRTDADGDGVELLTTSPAPEFGVVDVNDSDNPTLKACVKGPGGLGARLGQLPLAWTTAGVGEVDSDGAFWRDAGASAQCTGLPTSGGFCDIGLLPIVAGSYMRPGSISDPPLIDPLGRAIDRICGLGSCQHGDITNGFASAVEEGVDDANINSLKTGVQTVTACIDKDGDLACGANDGAAGTFTMTWTGGGRNHNHLWLAGSESANHENGTSSISSPAGSKVHLHGWLDDEGDNGVPSTRVIWRFAPGIGGGGGNNAPGFFQSSDQMTNGTGMADAWVGSSILDAARTLNVLFCGDGDADGICDFTPAQFDINWGGPVGLTSITGLSVTPTTAVFGTAFSVAGSLLDTNGDGISSATVTVERRTLGDTTWVPVGTDTTDVNGDFLVTDHPAFSSDYRAVFAGNVSFSASTSNTDRIWVRVGIALNASDTTAFVGEVVRLSGRVLPAHPGAVVTLQYLDDGHGWVNVATTHLSAGSTYAFLVSHGAPRSALYRVTFPTQTILNAWNVSRNIRVTWT